MKEGRIARNVIFNFLRAGFLLPLELILIPFVLHRIGVAGFGIWALLRVFTGYGTIFDLGISVATEKYTAEHLGRRDYHSLRKLLNLSFLAYLAIGIIVICTIFFLRDWIAGSFFKDGFRSFGEISFILLLSAGTFGINLLFSPFTSLLNGMQRIDLTNTISMIGASLNFTGILLVLGLGLGLTGIVAVNGAVVLITGLGSLWLAYRMLPEVRLNFFPPFFKFSEFLKIISYSLSVQSTRLAIFTHLHVDKFFIGYFLGLQYVTYYEIASRLVERLRVLPQMLIQPIMVAVSELRAVGRESEIDRIYKESLRAMALLSLPVFVFIFFFINPLAALWLGNAYPLTIQAFRVLVAAHLINMLTGPGFLILLGIGLPGYGAICSLTGVLLNIGLGYLLIITLGYDGTLLATFCSIVLPSTAFILIFHRIKKIPPKEFLLLVSKPVVVSLCSVLLVFATVQQLALEGLTGLLVAFLSFLALCCTGTWMTLRDEERMRIRDFLSGIRYRTY